MSQLPTPLRCAIIGCGPNTPGKAGVHSIAYAHAAVMGREKSVKLVAAASRSEKNIFDFVAEFPGTEGFRDYREMLRKTRPDVVSVCAFPADREAMVLAAIDNGAKAVWIEKPLAESLGAAQRIIAAAQRAGVRLFVNHQRRYGKPFEWWRDAVADPRLKNFSGIDVSQPCVNLLDFGPHLIDAALFAIGTDRKATKVFAAAEMDPGRSHHGLPIEKHLLASVHFDDNSRLTVETTDAPASAVPALRANFSNGFVELRLSPLPGEGSVFRADFGDGKIVSPKTDDNFHHTDDILVYVHRALVDIVEAINTGRPCRLDVAEGYRSLEIMLGVYESARTHRVLTFPLAQQDCPLRLPAIG